MAALAIVSGTDYDPRVKYNTINSNHSKLLKITTDYNQNNDTRMNSKQIIDRYIEIIGTSQDFAYSKSVFLDLKETILDEQNELLKEYNVKYESVKKLKDEIDAKVIQVFAFGKDSGPEVLKDRVGNPYKSQTRYIQSIEGFEHVNMVLNQTQAESIAKKKVRVIRYKPTKLKTDIQKSKKAVFTPSDDYIKQMNNEFNGLSARRVAFAENQSQSQSESIDANTTNSTTNDSNTTNANDSNTNDSTTNTTNTKKITQTKKITKTKKINNTNTTNENMNDEDAIDVNESGNLLMIMN